MDPVRELKVRAEVLHHAARKADTVALARLRKLVELRDSNEDALRAAAEQIQRKHCLAVVAREVGFANWEHALRVIEGDATEPDFGTALYDKQWGAHLNLWFASYDEAHAQHAQRTEPAPEVPLESRERAPHYLLAYKRHFFIVDRYFIDALGLDADDVDWSAIAWDWARPQSIEARRRLYGKLFAAQRARGN